MQPVLPPLYLERVPGKSTERQGSRQTAVEGAGPLTFGKMKVKQWLGARRTKT